MHQKRLALSFRGGGGACSPYFGVLKALEDNGIEVDYLIGSSAGSLVGAVYAAGLDMDSAIELFSKFSWKNFWSLKSLTHANPSDTESLKEYCKQIGEGITFEDTRIPFWAQVTNIDTYETENLHSGSLVDAVVASCAFPLMLDPVEIDGRRYWDGDLTSGYANTFLRSQGAEVVIGFNANNAHRSTNLVMHKLIDPFIVMHLNALQRDIECDPPNLVMSVGEPTIGVNDFEKARQGYAHGYAFVVDHLDQIKKLVHKRWIW